MPSDTPIIDNAPASTATGLVEALRAAACDVDGRRVADERLTYAAERRRGALQAVRDALVELEVANRHHDDAVRAFSGGLSRRNSDAAGSSGLSRPNTDAAGAALGVSTDDQRSAVHPEPAEGLEMNEDDVSPRLLGDALERDKAER